MPPAEPTVADELEAAKAVNGQLLHELEMMRHGHEKWKEYTRRLELELAAADHALSERDQKRADKLLQETQDKITKLTADADKLTAQYKIRLKAFNTVLGHVQALADALTESIEENL